MEYIVINGDSLDDVTRIVNAHIQTGWEPMGGVAVSIWNGIPAYFQAMIKN
jgi:hypothetical protein